MNVYILRNEASGEPHLGLLPGEHPAGTPEEAAVIAETPEEALNQLKKVSGEPINWMVHSIKKAVKNPLKRGVLYITPAPERPPVLCANDLFKLPGIESYCPVSDDRRCETRRLGHDQNVFFGEDVVLDQVEEDKNERVKSRIVWDPYIDDRRTHTITTIWYDGNPIGIVQTAGRDGEDFGRRFITDLEGYKAAADYLRSLYFTETNDYEVIDPGKPLRELNDFYNNFAFLDSTK